VSLVSLFVYETSISRNKRSVLVLFSLQKQEGKTIVKTIKAKIYKIRPFGNVESQGLKDVGREAETQLTYQGNKLFHTFGDLVHVLHFGQILRPERVPDAIPG
jgi:hypothetical protein